MRCVRCGGALMPDGDKWVHDADGPASHFPDPIPDAYYETARRRYPRLCPNCDRPRVRGEPCVCGVP